jgi:RHS repeat-associated protein
MSSALLAIVVAENLVGLAPVSASMSTPPPVRMAPSPTDPANSPCHTATSPGPLVIPGATSASVHVLNTGGATSSDFHLSQPSEQLIWSPATYGVPDQTLSFAAGAPLVFYIYTPYFGTSHYSDGLYAQRAPYGPGEWIMCFEDTEGGDNDYDDLVVAVYLDMLVEPPPPGTGPGDNGGDAGDPVQTFSGAFRYRHTDVAIAGAGPTPTFTRSYSSADTRTGPLGPGWTDNFLSRIRKPNDSSGDLYVVTGDGTTDRFIHNPDGTYTAEPSVKKTLVRNADNMYTLQDKTHATWTFNPFGALMSYADPTGLTSALTYDSSDRLISVSDPGGRGSLSIGYDGSSRIATVTDWSSPARTVTYRYDGQGRLSTVTDRTGKVTTYGYDGTSSRLASITDARTNVALTLTYDGSGRVATQKDARGLTTGDATTFGYVVNGDGTRVTTVTQPVTSFEPTFHPTLVDSYDTHGWLLSRVTHPTSTDTLTEAYTYDTAGNRTSMTDPAGKTTDFCYDADYAGVPIATSHGNVTRRIDPAPTAGAARPVTLNAYDALDYPAQVVSPNGVASGPTVTCSTDFSASAASPFAVNTDYSGGQLVDAVTKYTDPDLGLKVATTTYDINSIGQLFRIYRPRSSDPSDPAFNLYEGRTYKSDRTLLTSSDQLGDRWLTDHDVVGRLVYVDNPMGAGLPALYTTTYTYDAEDRLRLSNAPSPDGIAPALTTEYRYDDVGNPIIKIDPSGQVTKYVYDARDLLSEVHENPAAWTDPAVEPSGTLITRYAYDAAERLTRMTRADGTTYERVTDYTYDGRGLLRRETEYPNWPTTTPVLVRTYTYDSLGRLKITTDPSGATTTNTYDALGRVVGIDYSDAATPDVTYAYDRNGNRTTMIDGTGTTTYTYDEMNRPTSIAAPGGTVGYRYDLDGNRRKVIYPDGTAVTYGYDKADRLTTVTDWAGRVTTYTLSKDNLPTLVAAVDGSTTDVAADYDRRTTQITSRLGATVLIDRRTYSYDALGNVKSASSGLATNLVSVATTGATGAGASSDTDVSADGRYVVFTSAAANLVASDTNAATDVFVRDTTTGVTTRLSVSATGVQATGASDQPSISADGRYVAFRSAATNLITGDTNAKTDIFVKDRTTGAIERVSVSSSGTQSTNDSDSPALSSDGRYVAFASTATNLVTSDTNAKADIFLRDRQTSTTTRLSVSTSGTQSNNTSELPDVSDDGNRITFSSTATNLVTGDTNAVRDVFVRDRAAVTTTRVSVSTSGTQATNLSEHPAISGDGTTIAFESTATNLVSGDTNAKRDIFTRKLATNTTTRVSLTDTGAQTSADSLSPAISTSGSLIAFSTTGAIVTDDFNGVGDVFVRDTGAATTRRISLGTMSQEGNGASTAPALNADGSVTTFTTASTSFTASDGNGATDVFLRASLGDDSTYAYDKMARLTSSSEPTVGATSYTYDPVGNRLTKVQGTSTSYGYDKADRITSAGATSVTVNSVGDLLARGSDTFGYDGANRLKSAVVGAVSETYSYDGDGNRTRKVAGAVTTPYVFDTASSLPLVLTDGTRKFVWGRSLLYSVTGTSIEVVHQDALGSARAITNATGGVVATFRTDAYGVPTATSGSATEPFHYTGELVDATGLVDLRARTYDPSLGRFYSRDTVCGAAAIPLSRNRTIYALDNPVSSTDPSGHKSKALTNLETTKGGLGCVFAVYGAAVLSDASAFVGVVGVVLVTGGGGSIAVTLGLDAPVGAAAIALGLMLDAAALLGEGAAVAIILVACNREKL